MNEKVEVGRILKECFEKRERKVSYEVLKAQRGGVREMLEKYNRIVEEIEHLSEHILSKEEYEKRIGEVKRT